jgi:hypothetical protein
VRKRARRFASAHVIWLQRLEVLFTLLLLRQRQPPAGAGATNVGAALVSLPSGLIALIGGAMAKLETRLEASGPKNEDNDGYETNGSPDEEEDGIIPVPLVARPAYSHLFPFVRMLA